MSDEDVRAALRSDHGFVVVEAPAGCGKTHQGADYARELVENIQYGRPLILTHTHAAGSVFAERTKGTGRQVEIRTIDGIIANIAAAYHVGLGVPADVAAWVRAQEGDGYRVLAQKVAALLVLYPMISSALAKRYPVVICDEHQDCSGDQHAIVMAMLAAGAKVRVFADPMQSIFRSKPIPGSNPPWDWTTLRTRADACGELDVPYRWKDGSPDLGAWILAARRNLLQGQPIDLRTGLPESIVVVEAENRAQRRLEYSLSSGDRRMIDRFVDDDASLLILTHHNQTARAFRGFFGRRFPLWEGHTRPALESLVEGVSSAGTNSAQLAELIVSFMGEVGKGFSLSSFGKVLIQEAAEGCRRIRKGKAADIQSLARCVVEDPGHRGVAKCLAGIAELRQSDAAFAVVEIDHHSEFREAIRLGDYEHTAEGLAAITQNRTYSRPRPARKAISTIHKAKGLECDNVLLLPCDATTFREQREARCLLYVALSRAKRRLMLVVSRENPSPLFRL
ncbi:MAG: ATP-binding domain-containing protein [Gemmatimonadaceae bacterium]